MRSSDGDLLAALTRREIQVRYKQAFLGMAWAVFLPFSLMLVMTAVRGGFAAEEDSQVPYALWSYCGLLPWTFHQVALKGCTGTLVTNKNLLQKVYFPREIFPLAKIGAALVDFAVGLLVLAALMAWFGVVPGPAVLLFPVVLLVHVTLVVGLAGPALLSWLTWETAKIRSTQSATGILYVDFFTVVVGEVLAKYLLLATRVPV